MIFFLSISFLYSIFARCPAVGSFYVSSDWTSPYDVQLLAHYGHEIGMNGAKDLGVPWWTNASVADWCKQIGGTYNKRYIILIILTISIIIVRIIMIISIIYVIIISPLLEYCYCDFDCDDHYYY